MTITLGVSALYHDSAACLVRDGALLAAAQEERFTRVKFDASLPVNAFQACLFQAALNVADIDHLAFYENPRHKLSRIMWSIGCGMGDVRSVLNTWNEKTGLEALLRDAFVFDGPIHWLDHHYSHAASAYLLSPFTDAAILVADGVGEWATSSLWFGRGGKINTIDETWFPSSLGLFYSAITSFLGFQPNSDEYKVMGLSSYGEPKYVDRLRKVLHIGEKGKFSLDGTFLDYNHAMFAPAMTDLLNLKPRATTDTITQQHRDIAKSAQELLEDALLGAARRLHEETESRSLCMAGGVALNCVANSRILMETPFENIFVQPAAGDAGGCLGAAMAVSQMVHPEYREPMKTCYLGPAYDQEVISTYLRRLGVIVEHLEEQELLERTATELAAGKVVGWFQGRMEFGPRALGARSILADPRWAEMQHVLNARIKRRESFRPFAPICRLEDAPRFFYCDRSYPFMTFTVKARRPDLIPSAVHVDQTARLQTVDSTDAPLLAGLLQAFGERTGVPVLINTSFNLAGEPIVCSPEDAFNCFRESGMDVLVMGPFFVDRNQQDRLLLTPGSYPYMSLGRETAPYLRDTYFFT